MQKNPSSKSTSSPAELAKKAAAMPWKENARLNLLPYEKAIVALRERGYSYGEIATWLATETNAPVKRGQVYYVCQQFAALAHEAFEKADARGEVQYLPKIELSPGDAERAALKQDEGKIAGPKKSRGKK